MMSSLIPQEIDSFCARWSDALTDIAELKGKIEYVANELPALLRIKQFLVEILCNLIKGERYPDLRKATMFDNEFLLYADPGRSFSLRLFIWAPGEYTTIHDHNSWGVIGPASGEMNAVNYRKEDRESESGSVRLVETERLRLSPGETTFTLPLDEGIHKVGNPTPEHTLSLSVYGSPLPRGYINEFDITTGRVRPLFGSQVKKKLRVIDALPDLDRSSSEDILKHVSKDPLEVIRTASLSSLERLDQFDKV